MPTNEMSPQERAAVVYRMMSERPHRATELAAAAGLNRTSIYALLKHIPEPVARSGGYWSISRRAKRAELQPVAAEVPPPVVKDDRIKSEFVITRIHPDLKESLVSLAKSKGMNTSEVVTSLIEQAVKGNEAPAISDHLRAVIVLSDLLDNPSIAIPEYARWQVAKVIEELKG